MDMMPDVISPVLVFVVTAGLAGIGAEVMSLARTAKATQEAVKALMRSDLVDRYRTYRDCGGWMSDRHKDEWLRDYAIYHALVGKNGYIDAIRDRVVDMPNTPHDGASPPGARCVGRPSDDEPRTYD
ncbi:MAG: hypothetical protein ACRC75_06855 [Olsenella sp.]